MPVFKYVAKDKQGHTISASIEADSPAPLVASLRDKGLVIISVKEEKPKKGFSGLAGLMGNKIKTEDLVIFSRQLATMVDAGIPVTQGLDILSEQVENKKFKNIITTLRDDIEGGRSLSEAFGKHPNAFSVLFVNMVKAGESSGTLDLILDRLAGYMEKTSFLMRRVKAALVYPAVITTIAFGITVFLIIKVVPVFKGIYEGFGAQLPLPTQLLLSLSDFMRQYFLLGVAGVIAAVFLVSRYAKTASGKFRFDQLKLKLPVFGLLLKKVAISRFSRTLSTLVKSGVPILNSLEIVAKTAGNRVVEIAVNNARESIREGENISDPLTKSGIFPPLVVRMIGVGEKTGELEKMLAKIADFYDEQVDAAVTGLTSMIEPLIIAFLGLIIGGIVVSMYLPIFKISELIQM
ncbi:MAG: type II secretion system F family protein [Candidatus Omnitrophota bacterium]|nr:type II secretion system F family protein [Candidatus Omnitrophota bacterium]